jgi:hypothetical protein
MVDASSAQEWGRLSNARMGSDQAREGCLWRYFDVFWQEKSTLVGGGGHRKKQAWMAKRDKASNGGKKITSIAPAWLKISSDKTNFEILPERAKIVDTVHTRTYGEGLKDMAMVFSPYTEDYARIEGELRQRVEPQGFLIFHNPFRYRQ